MGNPRCKGIALGWLSDERFPRACSTSAGCFACKQDSGRAKALGICHRCRTAPTGLCRARQRSFVKAAVVYTDRLAPGFKSDWQDHSSIQVQTAFVKLSRQDCLCDRSLTSTPNNSSGTLAKTIKTINCSFLPPSYVYLTWLAMRLAH
jgi:hypothetical protein